MLATRRSRRWRRVPPPAPAPVIQLRGRAAQRVLAAQYGAGTEPEPSAFYRFRHQLLPAVWGVLLIGASLALRLAGVSPAPVVIAAAACAGAILVFSRHLSRYARRACMAVAALTAFWLPVMAALGFRPWLAVFAGCWAVLLGVQAHHYRIRDDAPGPTKDEETWARLTDHKNWDGTLSTPERIPGGVRYRVQTDGIRTHIHHIVREPVSIAAAWHTSVDQAYIEPSPDGVASRGTLTLLRRSTLQQTRHWNGAGVTPDGLAVIGRFADGADARIRLFAPRDGARHSLIAGTTGSGKTALLDLLIRIYLVSGIYPLILDPQNGQSLPQWRGRVPYAAGVDECMELLTLLHEGMMNRSRRLAGMEWRSHGRTVQGMPFFDAGISGMPLVRGLFDEHPVLLTDRKHGSDAAKMTGEIGKLGRKAGVGEDVAAQVPSLAQLADQVVRSMLVGGNVIGLRTGDRQSGSMAGLPADPYDLPRQFPDSTPTYGLGYVLGPDNRQAIGRTDVPTEEQMGADYPLPRLEPEFAAILGRFGRQHAGASAEEQYAAAAAQIASDDLPAPGGQTAADAILAVLTREMSRGELIKAARQQSIAWGRGKPFEMRSITTALSKLVDDGRVARTDHGVYAPVRPSLSLIGEA